jgi:hypothetical protein
MKTIIISDLHNRVNWIESALSSPILKPYNNVVFLGDYFDEFYDTTIDAYYSATWLKQSLHKPNRIHLWGTHDVWYSFPYNPFVMASGNTIEKAEVINNVLTIDDWNLIRPYYYEQNFLMTHAGVHPYLIGQYALKHKYIFGKYIVNNTIQLGTQDIVDQIIKPATEEALKDVKNNIINLWFEAGFARLGKQKFGGITWLDWNKEFQPIPDINQIIGHTTIKFPEEKITDNSKNYCLDTRNRHIGILENGELTIVETIDVLEAVT